MPHGLPWGELVGLDLRVANEEAYTCGTSGEFVSF